MSYLVLARKWRPQTFADLVGQEHVAQTLRNAIAQDRLAHAFLFTGARGVGKTTIARVLAKSLNCLSATGSTATPCAKCAACDEIARGTDVDVKEIDGASNNSVDDVRRLQESLPYLPVRDRFKVVIIDEVHMLSTGAFNALLKTLEEPPPHVKFIFATTEVHKVPITILSRCQRYDFKLIPTQKIRERVEYILGQEGVEHDAAAVALVSREAAGSMRDALSLLDQVIAGAAGKLTGVDAAKLLGVANRSVLYDLVRALIAGDAARVLTIVQTVANEGYDLATFARDFLAVLRDLVVARVVPEPDDLLDLADDERADVIAIARECDRSDLERLFHAWSRTTDDVARAREQRWVLEMALVRLAHRPPLLPVDDLVQRLVDLEKRLGAGGGGDPPRGPTAGGGAGGRPVGAAPTGGRVGAAPAPGGARMMGDGEMRAGGTSSATAASAAAPAWLARAQSRASEPAPSVVVVETRPSAPPPAPAKIVPPVEMLDTRDAARSLETWATLVESMEAGPIAILKHAVPLEVNEQHIRIAFETGSFYARKVASGEAEGVIVAAAERVLGTRPTVEILQGALPEDAPTIARRDDGRRAEARARREEVARNHPMVRSFLQLVGGEIRSIKVDE
ncbi:MAG: DNA polymerase III subunit gamma/tau [Deltaproteobacteria bacterium]